MEDLRNVRRIYQRYSSARKSMIYKTLITANGDKR